MGDVNFDRIINRVGTDSIKWDGIPYDFRSDDMIAMWVADMDFACPQEVLRPMLERLNHPIFGYMQLPESYYGAIIQWQKKRYGAQVEKRYILPVASVLGGVAMAVQALTQPGDKVLIHTPAYPSFYNTVADNGRRMVYTPLRRRKEGRYEIDFAGMERKMEREGCKLLLLCSPHNPTGRLWSREELSRVVEMCLNHHVTIVSDEIHADITQGNRFITTLSSHPRASECTIALYAPTKTFNIAGLCTAFAVIPNEALREKFHKALLASTLTVKNTLGVCALIGGYENGGAWVDALNCYVLDNARFACGFIKDHMPLAHAYLPQATYFLWIDLGRTGLPGKEIISKCVEEAHVALSSGLTFLAGGEQCVRMNIACPRSVLREALERLARVFKDR